MVAFDKLSHRFLEQTNLFDVVLLVGVIPLQQRRAVQIVLAC
jgi:hypothetical protein